MRRARLAAATAVIMLATQSASLAGSNAGLRLNILEGEGNFSSECGFSHRLPDDPIVAPRRPGASHSHDFFANTSTNAHSTYTSLRASSAICLRPADTAAYWVPTMYQNGRALKPHGAVAYYFTAGKDAARIRAYPAGLRVIAGDSRAPRAQSPRATSWSCKGSSARSSQVPTCAPGSSLRLHVRFPDCWNGRDLDSADHKSHLAYSDGRCPPGYGVSLPLLSFTVTYPTSGGLGITLSSGSSYTAHGDYFNAWYQPELQRLVRTCLNGRRNCGSRG